MLPQHAFLVLAALYGRQISAQPRLTFPLNAQLPAVAVVDEVFSFTFSANTFLSGSDIVYSLENGPSWLHLEGTTRTLTGKPSEEDIGAVDFGLVAADSTGSATSDSSLVVIQRSSVAIRQDVIAERLGQAGEFSAPATLLLQPQSPFRLFFGPEVFEGVDSSTQYYASSDNNTPLPAWLAFDPALVAFIGTTPPLLTPQSSPQSFALNLVASQIAGFSQAALGFQISVTNHVLAFLQPVQRIELVPGKEVSIPPLVNQLMLDDSQLDKSRMTSASSNQPEWLRFDSEDLSFSGLSPEDFEDTSFRLSVGDDQDNLASIEIQLLVADRKDNGTEELSLGTVTATIGDFFSYVFGNTSSNNLTQEIDVSWETPESWLTFTKANLTLHGTVPMDTDEGDLDVSLAVLEDGRITAIGILTIMLTFSDLARPSMSSSAEPTKPPIAPTATATSLGSTHDQAANERKRDLVLMIALPLLGLLVICLLALMLWRRRQNGRATLHTPAPPSPMRQSSRTFSSGNIVVPADPEMRSLSEAFFEQLPSSPPPRVDLPWPLPDRPRNKFLSIVDEHDRDSPETRSSWDGMLMEAHGPGNYGLDAGPNEGSPSPGVTSRLLESRQSSTSPTKRTNTPMTETLLTERSGSFTTPRRFNGRRSSGLGHGAGSQRATMRQVPLSPLSETARTANTPFNPTSGAWTTPNYKVLQPNTSFIVPASTRKTSLASSESKYAAPRSESSSEQASAFERRAASRLSLSSVYDDDEWMTEGSTTATQSSSQHSRHPTGGNSSASNNIFAGHEAARQWPLQPALPSEASQGVSLRSQISERSQGNSLRFI